jgi:hypothetical protein
MVSNYGLVKQRRSRLSYGILSRIEWVEKLHGDKNVVKATSDLFDRDEDCRWVQAIDWLVRQVSLKPFTHISDIQPLEAYCYLTGATCSLSHRTTNQRAKLEH